MLFTVLSEQGILNIEKEICYVHRISPVKGKAVLFERVASLSAFNHERLRTAFIEH